jgi:hypothetical protein
MNDGEEWRKGMYCMTQQLQDESTPTHLLQQTFALGLNRRKNWGQGRSVHN